DRREGDGDASPTRFDAPRSGYVRRGRQIRRLPVGPPFLAHRRPHRGSRGEPRDPGGGRADRLDQRARPSRPRVEPLGPAGLFVPPDGTGGTRWTVVGSYFDELVPGLSAIDMHADVRIVYRVPRYEHSEVLFDARTNDVSTRDESDGGAPAQRLHDRPESIR